MMVSSRSIIRPRNEAPVEVRRASGDCICKICGKIYYKHQEYQFTDHPGEDNYTIILVKVCTGEYFKL